MKRKLFILPVLITALMACNSGAGNAESDDSDSTKTATEAKEDYSDMQAVDLNEFGVPASIYVPGDDKGKLQVNENTYGSVEIRVGDRFGLEVVPSGMSIVEKRNELEQGSVFKIEVMEERENYMLYRKYIPNSEVLEEFHIFLTREIDGEVYEVKSLAEMELSEARAREVLRSAQSMTAKAAI